MRRNPERTAWIILSLAFATFWVVVVLVISLAYWYVFEDTQAFVTEVTSVRGIVLVKEPDTALTTSITDGATLSVQEGAMIITDDTSQAILTFKDDNSLTMYGNTAIVLHEMQTPRFSFSFSPIQIRVELQDGRIRTTAARNRTGLHFDVLTPHTTIQLNQGSFSTEVTEEETQLTVRLGEAAIVTPQEHVTLSEGRIVVDAQGLPSEPLPAAQNLLERSTFSSTFTNSWQIYDINLAEEVVTTTIRAVPLQGRTVVELRSYGQDNIHTETGIIKTVEKDVRDFRSLKLLAELRLLEQSLPGGGQLGSEFPIMLTIAYKDAEGNDRNWYHGFYYAKPPDNYILYNQPENSNDRIARYIWYPYESDNLLVTLGPMKPIYVKSVRIYASGWLYHSMVGSISLLAEE